MDYLKDLIVYKDDNRKVLLEKYNHYKMKNIINRAIIDKLVEGTRLMDKKKEKKSDWVIYCGADIANRLNDLNL